MTLKGSIYYTCHKFGHAVVHAQKLSGSCRFNGMESGVVFKANSHEPSAVFYWKCLLSVLDQRSFHVSLGITWNRFCERETFLAENASAGACSHIAKAQKDRCRRIGKTSSCGSNIAR